MARFVTSVSQICDIQISRRGRSRRGPFYRETADHFLFRCIRWNTERKEMLQCTTTQRGNISFFLGGKAPSDNDKWTPKTCAFASTSPLILYSYLLYRYSIVKFQVEVKEQDTERFSFVAAEEFQLLCSQIRPSETVRYIFDNGWEKGRRHIVADSKFNIFYNAV